MQLSQSVNHFPLLLLHFRFIEDSMSSTAQSLTHKFLALSPDFVPVHVDKYPLLFSGRHDYCFYWGALSALRAQCNYLGVWP